MRQIIELVGFHLIGGSADVLFTINKYARRARGSIVADGQQIVLPCLQGGTAVDHCGRSAIVLHARRQRVGTEEKTVAVAGTEVIETRCLGEALGVGLEQDGEGAQSAEQSLRGQSVLVLGKT